MASTSRSGPHILHVFITLISALFVFPLTQTSSVIEDLNSLKPPPDFNVTLTTNCLINPSLRYCNFTPFDLHEIFKFTIVASYLCNVSNNPNCVESFPKIDLRAQPKIAPLYLSFSFFWKYCPLTVVSIDLSNNALKGSFPSDLFHCSQVQAIDLSHNELSGDLPVKNFSVLKNLSYLNLSYNQFSEVKVSETPFLQRFNSSGFLHSGLVPNHKEFKIKAVLLLIGFPVLVILLVVLLGLRCNNKADKNDHHHHHHHQFSPSIIEEATDDFSDENLVEKTRGASIYRGEMSDGGEVRVDTYFQDMSDHDTTRFIEKCSVLVRLHHKNIVSVLGWCDSRRFKAIVSESRNGDSIEDWLLKSNPSWRRRVRVILEIADAVAYLHEEETRVVCNLKTRNIATSEDGEPVITRLKLDDHHAEEKNIFRFGMFLLEMVTNMRPMEGSDMKETGFLEWLKLHYPENLQNVIDKNMKKTTPEIVAQAVEIIKLGFVCTDMYTCNQELRWDQVSGLLRDILIVRSHADKGRSAGKRQVHR